MKLTIPFFSFRETRLRVSLSYGGGINHAWSIEASRRWERSVCREIVIYKEEVTGMIVFRRGWRSQTFRLPFSGWLALAILWIFFTGAPPPGVFILAHLSLGNRRVIPGREATFFFFCPFFLSFFPFLHSLVFPRSQVLTKNLVQWTDLNDARRVWIGSVHPRNSNASRRRE